MPIEAMITYPNEVTIHYIVDFDLGIDSTNAN